MHLPLFYLLSRGVTVSKLLLNLKLLLQCLSIEVGTHIMSLIKNLIYSSQKTRCIPLQRPLC